MDTKDYRARLAPAEFESISSITEDPMHEYFQRLIAKNPKFAGIDDLYPRGFGDIHLLPHLTEGQRILIVLAAFDGEVDNGGITQFFWNFPEYSFEVRNAIKRLGNTALLQNYERAMASLADKLDEWSELRDKCYRVEGSPDWESFSQSYDLLALDWFNDVYSDLQHEFLHQLAEYVRSHRFEFIEESEAL